MDREDQILNYLQGKLPHEAAARFEDSLAADTKLAAEVAVLKEARRLMAEDEQGVRPDDWPRLSAAIDAELAATPANTNAPLRLSLLQAACLAIAAVGLWQFVAAPLIVGEPAGYTTASDGSTDPVLQVTFAPEASLAEISDLLRALQGRIIDGPSAIGLFRVAFPDDAARDAAVEAMRLRTDLTIEVLEQ